MSDNEQMSSGQPEAQASGSEGDKQHSTSGSDSVKYDTYKKLLGEKKAADQRLKSLEEKLNTLEVEKMSAEGNKDELIQKLQDQVRGLQDSLKQKDQAYAFTTLGSQVKTEAAKMGCQDPDSLVKLMDLSGIPVDPDSYTGDVDNIRMMLEDQKKARPFFFGKPAPQVHDVSQQNSVMQKPGVDFSSMSREELNDYLKKHAGEIE